MFQIQFTGQNIEITQTLHDFINDKFAKLERHGNNITSCHVILNVDKGGRQAIEAVMHVPGTEICAKAESEDMYKSIDALLDKLVRQLDKHREKIKGH